MLVDASVLLADALGEWAGDRGRFRLLLGRIAQRESIVSSPMLPFEVGQAIHRKGRSRGTTPHARSQARQALLALAETLRATDALLDEAARISETAPTSYYDASYLACATLGGETLLTADRGMHAHALALGLRSYLLPGDLARLEADHPEPPPRNA